MTAPKLINMVKTFIFIAIVGALFAPMITQRWPPIEFNALNGSFTPAPKPTLQLDNWLNGEFQQAQEKYLNENIGCHNFLVRFYNQWNYDLFRHGHANGVIVGKDDYLFEKNYIDAYNGSDYVGLDAIQTRVKKTKIISDMLRKKGIELIVVLAPGKASYHPEFLPDIYQSKPKSITNYESYSFELKKSGIHLLDFQQWFLENKNKCAFPLYPRTGTHWSKYGELLVADSIIHFINSLGAKQRLPELNISSIDVTDAVRDTDDDIEKGMNLLYPITDLTMGYPHFQIKKDSLIQQARVLTIADSYYWGIFNWGCSRDVFGGGQFWYYNTQIYPDSYEKDLFVGDISIRTEVEKNDVVIILSTDANLSNFSFGFVDQILPHYLRN